MTCGRDHNRSVDGIGVHATLVIVMHGDESPICDDASDTECTVCVGAGDEIFNCGGIEELDVGERKDFREEGGGEKRLLSGV